jgi:coenzyme F420 hydrogenase subunit beta
VIACPHDVLSYDDTHGRYKPFHVDADGGPEDCTHGLKGCTMCTRACPRFRLWEPEIETHLFGRERTVEEVAGISSDTLLVRATDPEILAAGQDGGLVSTMLVWALEHDVIDAALVSYLEGDGSSWKAVPGVATTREQVLAAAGSRYTYSANPLAYPAAIEGGAERVALVGMGCQASAAPMMKARKAGKIARRLSLTIGLLCSKTFDDAIFPELFEARYNIHRSTIAKMNIKGVFQVWTHDGGYHEIPLKEAHAWTREGCTSCPDFAAEHADISTGGIGASNDWTLTLVRTDAGRELLEGMLADGVIETRPGDEDPGAIALLHRLARVSRRRWPETAVPMPRRLPPAATPA